MTKKVSVILENLAVFLSKNKGNTFSKNVLSII